MVRKVIRDLKVSQEPQVQRAILVIQGPRVVTEKEALKAIKEFPDQMVRKALQGPRVKKV
jgi:hypothetical protein